MRAKRSKSNRHRTGGSRKNWLSERFRPQYHHAQRQEHQQLPDWDMNPTEPNRQIIETIIENAVGGQSNQNKDLPELQTATSDPQDPGETEERRDRAKNLCRISSQ